MRTWLLLLAASTASAAPAKTVKVAVFGELSVADGDFIVMERGNASHRMNVLTVAHDFTCTKRSWDDKPGKRTNVRTGGCETDKVEREFIAEWSAKVWPLAPGGHKAYSPASSETEVYRWAIVLRRDKEIRVIEGGGGAHPEPQPAFLEQPLEFLGTHF